MSSIVNEKHINFVMQHVDNGLSDLVSKLEMNENNTRLDIDINPVLVEAFKKEFSNTDLNELNKIVENILIISIARIKEKEKINNG